MRRQQLGAVRRGKGRALDRRRIARRLFNLVRYSVYAKVDLASAVAGKQGPRLCGRLAIYGIARGVIFGLFPVHVGRRHYGPPARLAHAVSVEPPEPLPK